jgi:hypothetical protein
MTPNGPLPNTKHPITGVTRTGFLKPFITRPTISVGHFTYYDDPKGPENFESNKWTPLPRGTNATSAKEAQIGLDLEISAGDWICNRIKEESR